MAKKFNILALGGGGVRGPVIICALKRIEQITGKQIHELFDLIAGTSTGGIIAAAISTGIYTLDDILEMYLTNGSEIFPQTGILKEEKWLIMSKYSARGIEAVLNEYLKDFKLSQANTNLMILSQDENTYEPLIFTTLKAKDPNFDVKLFDCARATSAGESYFPSHPMEYPKGNLVNARDAGVYRNNPSGLALAEYIQNRGFYNSDLIGSEDIDYDNTFVLSLGTGKLIWNDGNKYPIDKGALYYATRVTDMAMHGSSEASHLETLKQMGEANYFYINPTTDNSSVMPFDDPSKEISDYWMKTSLANLDLIDQELKKFLNKII